MRVMRSFLTWSVMPIADAIQLSVMSSESCVWTSFGVVQAETRSAYASICCLSEINARRQNARTASKHSLVVSNSVLSCLRCKRSDKRAHSNRIFSFRCSANVCAAAACGLSLDRASIHWRASVSLVVGIPSALRRWTLDFEQFNFRESSRCVK